MRSQDVLLWVKSDFGYSGPVVGYFSVNVSVDGTVFESVSVSGVGGWECEEDFGASDVTHWAELPKGPGEE
ncbi:hypothetical protein [Burkholderia territorii]|uniref:hypothetical protein n=1 Tax=Burkholderia territorii TaxID=1503055 RepID=UPI0012D95200|nr:hypothetical protein [Burkholderia territorii]